MANFHSRRLQAVLGCPVDQADETALAALIAAGISEDYDLDFKQSLYGNGDSDKRALASDVAALANTAGGLIIIGVAENDQARAAAATPVLMSDDETRRMTQIIATLSPLPTADIYPVESDDPGQGYYLIAVPRSPLAPHAVPINNALRYPMRTGSTTRYLSEPEVAAAYRRRALGARDRDGAGQQALREGCARLDRSEWPWVCVCVVPDAAGELVITADGLEGVRSRFNGRTPKFGASAFMNLGVAWGRYLLGGGQQHSADKYVAADLHTDGTGFLAQQLTDITRSQSPQVPGGNHVISDEGIVSSVLASLMLLGAWARDDAHAGGTAVVHATLLPAVDMGLEIGHARGHGFGYSMSKAAWAGEMTPPVSASALLDDLASPSIAALQVGRSLSSQLAHGFGIPELPQISAEGAVRLPYWQGRDQHAVPTWAASAGLPVTDS